MLKDTPKYISHHMIEELVNTSGNDIVTGYYRHKKIKDCKGYKQACKKAALTLSYISDGQIKENGKCIVHIRFRPLAWLIPIIILILFLVLSNIPTKAIVRIQDNYKFIILPETTEDPVLEQTEYKDMYIQVPGYSKLYLNKNENDNIFFNPEKNNCILIFYVYLQNNEIFCSGQLNPGEEICGNFNIDLETGEYNVDIITYAYSLDGETEFNSVKQEVILKVEEDY